eukprot:CAMPEP_0194123412 /NCGR_PEP_ID=MMETSP0150-20130528/54419_1 /TAXON_ID=122233 /ORGANISM="Chaetoceros debilis, Strain MM31A-1" /LENGTH=508 /DNA_ID=CAMNT_0038816647 /DNA_START=81 /DNA_END=1604 /DNA_ORIENTATION=+
MPNRRQKKAKTENSSESPMKDLCENLWANVFTYLSYVDIQSAAPKVVDAPNNQNGSKTHMSLSASIEREEQALRCTSKYFHKLLTSEEFYQIKAIESFATNNSRSRGADENGITNVQQSMDIDAWPPLESVGGWRVLYDQILSVYAPLEGYCSICNAWPWGLLLECHFKDGKFCGDLVRAIQNNTIIEGSSTSTSQYIRKSDKIFEISFGQGGEAKCEIFLGDTEAKDDDQQSSTKTHALEFGFNFQRAKLLDHVVTTESPRQKDGFLFKINWDANTFANHNLLRSTCFVWPPVGTVPHLWNDDEEGPPRANEIITGIQKNPWHIDGESHTNLPQLLLEPLDIAWPSRKGNKQTLPTLRKVSSLKMPLTSGLYAGSYGSQYGCLRHEILHLSYIDPSCPKSLDDVFQSRMPHSDFLGSHDSSSVLLIGRKVTGDMHVPAGEITWFADINRLCGDGTAPATIEDQNGTHHRVVRSWNGLGTLSYSLFRKPSWDEGWLLELEANIFAFNW